MINAIKHEWICPITRFIMLDPAKAPCGHLFEKKAIEKWVSQHPRCPFDQRTIEQLIPDNRLRLEIHQFIKQYPFLFEGKSVEELERELEQEYPVDATANLQAKLNCLFQRAAAIQIYRKTGFFGGSENPVKYTEYSGAPIDEFMRKECDPEGTHYLWIITEDGRAEQIRNEPPSQGISSIAKSLCTAFVVASVAAALYWLNSTS